MLNLEVEIKPFNMVDKGITNAEDFLYDTIKKYLTSEGDVSRSFDAIRYAESLYLAVLERSLSVGRDEKNRHLVEVTVSSKLGKTEFIALNTHSLNEIFRTHLNYFPFDVRASLRNAGIVT